MSDDPRETMSYEEFAELCAGGGDPTPTRAQYEAEMKWLAALPNRLGAWHGLRVIDV